MEQKLRITGRERDVICLLANGWSNKQIGQQLGISNYTVRDHVSSMIRKLNVASRVELAVLAVAMKDEW
ncbi:response regulator transcription factor [Pseudomonas chlororaphis]|uniref:response regulator transcription factor n=1 Tax=Pseudomonas chlororaphis TaxID=587753 RepID=UPI000BBAC031|nr:LuxR C-terminal-related transcriptional regulator [Pseudomonas chlororaphis]